MTEKRQTPWMANNQNAAKPEAEKTKMVSVRLPADIVDRLRANGNQAAQIVAALRKFWGD